MLALKRLAGDSHGGASTLVLLPSPPLPSSLQVEAIFVDVMEAHSYYSIYLRMAQILSTQLYCAVVLYSRYSFGV